MLMAAAWKRMLIAAGAVAVLWCAVLWVAPPLPMTEPSSPPAPGTRASGPMVADGAEAGKPESPGTNARGAGVQGADVPRMTEPLQTTEARGSGPPNSEGRESDARTTEFPRLNAKGSDAGEPRVRGALVVRAVVRSGMPAPGGGRFDRFDVASQPVVAPVNARGQVVFHATVLRSPAREGLFLAENGRIAKVAAFGDPLPGGGALAEFAAHPVPALNAAGHVAFAAGIAGGRATEGMFLAADGGLRVIARTGDDAPGVMGGVLAGFDSPALNDNDEMAFVASVRRGRETTDVLYLWDGRRLRRLMAEGDRLLRIGGMLDKIGVPALNNGGVVAFPAAISRGPALGGIFIAGARELRLLVGAGDRLPDGAPDGASDGVADRGPDGTPGGTGGGTPSATPSRASSGAMILRFSERVAIDDEDGVAFGAYLGHDGRTREAVLRIGPDGPTEIAVEGGEAPGGGRYAGFGPWPTVAAGGVVAFIAALDDGPGPLAAFAGPAGSPRPVATMGETLPGGGRVPRFALNAVAVAGPGGLATFATMGGEDGEGHAIQCRCPPLPPMPR